MFDTAFDYSLIQKQPGSYKYILYEYIYQFYTNKRRYIAVVEEYEFHVFIVKFYPAERKRDPNRYSLVMNDFEFAPIIRTCINIMLRHLNGDVLASFGYIGANTITRK